MFFIGYVIGAVVFLVLIPWWLGGLFKKTEPNLPAKQREKKVELFRRQSVISFSFIIPIISLSLVFGVIVGARIAKDLFEQGHGDFVFFSLVFPIFSFLIGYLYLKKEVQ